MSHELPRFLVTPLPWPQRTVEAVDRWFCVPVFRRVSPVSETCTFHSTGRGYRTTEYGGLAARYRDETPAGCQRNGIGKLKEIKNNRSSAGIGPKARVREREAMGGRSLSGVQPGRLAKQGRFQARRQCCVTTVRGRYAGWGCRQAAARTHPRTTLNVRPGR
jgi:hypothetical protein